MGDGTRGSAGLSPPIDSDGEEGDWGRRDKLPGYCKRSPHFPLVSEERFEDIVMSRHVA